MLLPLTRGFGAIVDDDDAALIGPYKWRLHPASRPPGRFYVASYLRVGTGGVKTLYLHRLIMNAKADQHVDHINKDGLDNRRANLRLCSQGLNQAWADAKPNKTGFRGVNLQRHVNQERWRAIVTVDRKTIRSKWTHDPVEAAKMYDQMAREHHGQFARLNFPDGEEL